MYIWVLFCAKFLNNIERWWQPLSTSIFLLQQCRVLKFQNELTNYFIMDDIKGEDKKKAIWITFLSDGTYKLFIQISCPKILKLWRTKCCCRTWRNAFLRENSTLSKGRGSTALLKTPGRVSAIFAASCNFGSKLNMILRDIFVISLTTKEVSERLREVDAINLEDCWFGCSE